MQEWESGQNRFEQVGEALMVAYKEDVVAGIGRFIVHAGTPDAPEFWEAMGFEPHNEDGHSHILPSRTS